MKGSRRRRQGEAAGVDMGPMIDMVFLLLIFTLVTARLTQDTVVSTDPPESQFAQGQGQAALHVKVDAQGQVSLSGAQAATLLMASTAMIAQRLHQLGTTRAIVHAHKQTSTQDLLSAMDRCRSAGATHVDIAALSR